MNKKAAIIGGGVIGSGWAARFLLNGWDVSIFDPDPDSERKFEEVLYNARRSLPALYDNTLPREGKLSFQDDLSVAVDDAIWIQESVPEQLSLKRKVYRQIQKCALESAIVASSTSGFKPSQLQEGAIRPEQIIVAHPFNPVYLLPLVEIVTGKKMLANVCEQAQNIISSIGMKPLIVRKEIDAHIADRFLEAVWREGLWMIKDDIATTEEIDDAIRYGFGLRWAQMGLFETYRIAGGEAGMKHFISQFGPALAWPWTHLMDVPELTDELIDKITMQSDAQSGHMSIRELERLRDDNLVGIMRALKHSGTGAGGVITDHEKQMSLTESTGLPVTASRQIPQNWVDDNNHMNEAHYLEVFAQSSDRFLELIGADAEYIRDGNSYFTAESHIRYLQEVKGGECIHVTTQVLMSTEIKLHLFHQMFNDADVLVATGETLLLHTDLNTRRTSKPSESVASNIREYTDAHEKLDLPEGAGRYVGQAMPKS